MQVKTIETKRTFDGNPNDELTYRIMHVFSNSNFHKNWAQQTRQIVQKISRHANLLLRDHHESVIKIHEVEIK